MTIQQTQKLFVLFKVEFLLKALSKKGNLKLFNEWSIQMAGRYISKTFCAVLFCVFATATFATDVWLAQRLLTQLGYSPGPTDGLYGRKTQSALEAFYKEQGGVFDGKLDQNEIEFLREVSGVDNTLLIDVENKPSGVLSPSKTKKLWNSYKVASQCFEHPTYGKGKGIKIQKLPTKQFVDNQWNDPFSPKTPSTGSVSAYLNPPQPVITVRLNESYGSRDTRIDNAAGWFRSAATALRRGMNAEKKEKIIAVLKNWAENDALKSGINVSWGSKPVDWQVMVLISSILTTTAALSSDLSDSDRVVIGPWLNQLVGKVASSHWTNRADNKAYMTAYITMLWGLMISDPQAVQKTVDVVKLAVHDMRPDGSFPIDSQRSGMGLKYSSDSLGYLIMMSALIKANSGLDLFAYSVDGRSLDMGVGFMVKAVRNPSATNKIYAIPCPDGGDTWGSIANPSLSFVETATYLAVYAQLNPASAHTDFILSKYGDGTKRRSEVFAVPPGLLVRQ